ncbi:MAG: hypothetical protein HFE74_03195 [Firmicutes bacterium]|jgi:hypothetical protein|nr:hypothetical protein [Bacillota bacterium]
MSYICADRGTDKCPCSLMEIGQCYTCSMIKTGKCDCISEWQGVCPYTEYMQNGALAVKTIKTRQFDVKSVEDFSEALKVITLDVPMGFALECNKPGTFLMIEAGDYKIPLSVMESKTSKDSYVKLAVYLTGPKTFALDKEVEKGSKVNVSGPFLNGLINVEKFDDRKLSLVVAKGIAMMPLLNQKNIIGNGLVRMYMDDTKLTKEFIDKYVSQLEYSRVDMETDLEEIVKSILADCEYCKNNTGKNPNIFLMVSPYYKDIIINKCGFDENDIIAPNHANMCCGEGICGACSYTDKDGVTVRRCKCGQSL